jgi:hypothetical protein
MSNTLRSFAVLALLSVFSCATMKPIVTHTLSCVGVDFQGVMLDVERDLFAQDYAALEALAARFTFDVVACAVQAAMSKVRAERGATDVRVTTGQTWLKQHNVVVQ